MKTKKNFKQDYSSIFSSTEEIIKDLNEGKMVVIVDDEKRENEGDLVFNANRVDSDKINFMAKYARGLICLALEQEKADKLDLKLMSNQNASRHKTAFTVSIEAKFGVTTGISAKDRSKTIEVAVKKDSIPEDIVSPGHIFPVVAKNGGVLVRAGHTEAAVDLARLSGNNPSGVICEIMNDDGTMARLKDLAKFCDKYKLRIGSIKNLIEYRIRKEKFIKFVSEKSLKTSFAGNFKLRIYENILDSTQHLVLLKGLISKNTCNLVRMHTFNIFDDILDFYSSGSSDLSKCMKIINKHGSGVIVIIRNPRKELDLDNKNQIIEDSKKLKEYGIGAQILLDLGIKNISLLTNRNKKIIGIDGFGLKIENYISIKEQN